MKMTHTKLKEMLAKRGILYEIVLSDDPLPYHHETKLSPLSSYDNKKKLVVSMTSNPDLVIKTKTVHTHANTIAQRFWKKMKKLGPCISIVLHDPAAPLNNKIRIYHVKKGVFKKSKKLSSKRG